LDKRAFVVSSKQLLALPYWIRVADVFKNEKSDWALLKPLGLQPDDPQYERNAQRIQRLRGIREYPYVMQVLERSLAYEEVAEIFVRVNSLGVKLRGSDLALAQVTSRWKNSLRLFEAFAEELELSSFTVDIGILLRTMVVLATGQSRFKAVQTISLERLKEEWERSKEGLHFAVNFLRSNVGIEDESLLSSPLMIASLAAIGVVWNKALTAQEQGDLKRWVLLANAHGRYTRGSTESVLDQDLAIILRGGKIEDLFVPLKQQFTRLHFEPEDFVGKGARSPLFSTTYLALKANGARDWSSGLALSLNHQGKLHSVEYHHVFPKALLAQYGYEKSEINEIANMAFIGSRTNQRIANKSPAAYLSRVVEEQGEDALIAQSIPTDPNLWQTENYRAFLEWRRARLSDEVNSLLELAIVAKD
jgi:hypothetical protein